MKAKQKKQNADQEVRKLTPQRDAVFQVILNREDHPTAGEIFEAAKLRLPSISYATVYNSLRYLRDAGLVHEIKFGGYRPSASLQRSCDGLHATGQRLDQALQEGRR